MSYDLIISNIKAQIPLTTSEADFFTSLLEEKQVLKRKYLLRISEICRYDYFVNKGCLKVCYTNNDGEESIIKFAVENNWVVDLGSFLQQTPSFYYLQAIEDTVLFQLSKSNYELLHKEVPAFQDFTKQRWQNGFLALQQRIIQNLSLTAEERFFQFQEKYPGLDKRISQKLIASYLGITPEFLSVLRRKWATSFS